MGDDAPGPAAGGETHRGPTPEVRSWLRRVEDAVALFFILATVSVVWIVMEPTSKRGSPET